MRLFRQILCNFQPNQTQINSKITRQQHFAFIYSKIIYGLGAYGYSSASNISKNEIMQTNLLKLILKLNIRTRNNAPYKMMIIL